MKEKIGTNAGVVWSSLNGSAAVGLKDVKKMTKLSEKDLYAALGWLAREEKIVFEEKDDEVLVTVI